MTSARYLKAAVREERTEKKYKRKDCVRDKRWKWRFSVNPYEM
jgi:hypothetical protein